MTTLPTCPREDCTFAGPHHDHYRTTGEVRDRSEESDCSHCATPKYTHCYAPRTPQPQPYRFPDGWERGHEAKYWLQTGLTPYGLTLDPERAPGVLNWLGVNYYTPDSPHLPQPAVVLPTVDEVADVLRSGDGLRFYSDSARDILDLITERVPVWQPVAPGTTIKAGTAFRRRNVAGGWCEFIADEDLNAWEDFSIDPRTIPAEPEDPRVELVAEELHSHGGCEEEWPRCSVSTVENYRYAARDLLARLDAVRSR